MPATIRSAPVIHAFCPFVLLLTSLSAVSAVDYAPERQRFDILIRNGFVLDGTGNPAVKADVAVRGDTIVAVGRLSDSPARRVIDATGKFVTPGFIDMHSHADIALVSGSNEAREAASLVTQGITTAVGGADGFNTRWPLTDEIAALENGGIGMNVVLMVGHNTVRGEVMGKDHERAATESEIARLKKLVREGLDAGAWGLSAGLEYRPGRFSTPQEVLELAGVVAEYYGFYTAHQRSEASMPLWQLPSAVNSWPVDGLQALEETIEIARRTGIRVVASHMKSRGRSSFGNSSYALLVVDKARQEGLQVYLDVYPYETFSGSPQSMLPPWALVDDKIDTGGGCDAPIYRTAGVFDHARDNLRRRWADPAARARITRDIDWIVNHNGGADRVLVVDYPDRSLIGRNLEQVAKERGTTFEELVVDLALQGYPQVPGGARYRGYGILDLDVENYIRKDYTATSSDARVSGVSGVKGLEAGIGSHPRNFGAFVRKISRYVKDRRIISLPFAIRSATGLPAQIIGLRDRGYLRTGYKADLTILDYERLRDQATVLEPDKYSEGVDYVITNGVIVVEQGRRNKALPGVVIRRTD